MSNTPTTAAAPRLEADGVPFSDEVIGLIDHIAEILAEEFAAAMTTPKKESDDARSDLR